MPRHLHLFGGFELTDADAPVVVPAAVEHLVAWLALRGRTQRVTAAAMLWPDHPEVRAMANLRTAVWRLQCATPGLVVSHRGWLALADDVEVDVAEFERAARSELGDDPAARHDAAISEGDLLIGWCDDWLVVDRERLRQLRLNLLEERAASLIERGQFGLALEAALVALRADSLRESAHRAVIRVHLAAGNRADAYHAYESCRATLANELGVRPSQEICEMVSELTSRRHAS